MCISSDNGGGETPGSIERESGVVDTFSTTRNVGPVSEVGHSDLSASEAADISFNPASSLSTSREKAMAMGQAILPGGFLIGALRANALRASPGAKRTSLLGDAGGNGTLLGG